MKGILADINVIGQIEYLVRQMQADAWIEYWRELGLEFRRFEEVGLTATSSDLAIWQKCQEEQLALITDNRNQDSADSLEAVLRAHTTSESLPVFTISDLEKFGASRSYCEKVLESLYDYLLRIDTLRGTGRLYLP